MAEEIRAFIHNGSLNSENFFIDDDDRAASSDQATVICVGAAFRFRVDHQPPFRVAPLDRPNSKALNRFAANVNRAPLPSVTAALKKATEAYLAVADDLDAEIGAAEEGNDDGAAAEISYFDQSVAEGQAARKAEDARRAMEMQAAMDRIRAQFDVTALPKPAIDRITSDLSSVQRSKHYGWSAAPLGRNLAAWAIEMFDFEAGTALHRDMQTYREKTGKAVVELSMTFPTEYPFKPPFIRVVRPRFQFRTGHVTVGGSICTQLLTDDGWKPIYDVESIIETIRQQITDSESGARIDFTNTSDYTEREANEAFRRVAEYHRANGW